jgi:hypothetical protein
MCTHKKNLIPVCPTIQGFFLVCGLLTELYIYYAGLCQTHSAPFIDIKESLLMETKVNAVAPDISPSADSQPFLPLLAPSPLTPFTNTTVPKLSGLVYLPPVATVKPYNLVNSTFLLWFHGHVPKLLCDMKKL